MAFSLFGYELIRKNQDSEVKTFVRPEITEEIGEAKQIQDITNAFAVQNGFSNETFQVIESENTLITQYRDVARQPEVDKAIEEIVSEAIVADERHDSVKLDLSDVNMPESVKKKIHESFKKTLRLLNFRQKGYDIFRRWYIDGRINYHMMIDEKDIKRGVVQVRYIDPKKIKRVRKEIKDKNSPNNKVRTVEYYEYNEMGIDTQTTSDQSSVKISIDAIAHANSGLTNSRNTIIISYLDKAIAPANKLRSLENAMVIYRLVRAPERRIVYVDVGQLPKPRADQHMQSVIGKFKTKITYDTVTGKIRDDRNIMALTEDFFIPRSNGSKATEFDTLSSQGTNAGATEELDYHKKLLLESLNVPVSRLDNSMFNMGRNNEISRDEARFSKFIDRLRIKFNDLFDAILSRDLVLSGVMSIEDWEQIKQDVRYDYIQDNYFTELVEADILANRLGVLQQVEPFIGIHYSNEYVRKHILKQTDEEIKEIQEQIRKEAEENPDAHTTSDVFNQVDLGNRMNDVDIAKHQQQTDIDTDAEIALTKATNTQSTKTKKISSASDDSQPNPFRNL